METLVPDPPIICCAVRVCCEDGSPEQIAAVAALIVEDFPKKERTAAVKKYAQRAAATMVKHFLLHDREGRTRREEFTAQSK